MFRIWDLGFRGFKAPEGSLKEERISLVFSLLLALLLLLVSLFSFL